VLVQVSAAEAAARGTAPLSLAEEWASEIQRGVLAVREQGSWPWVLRVAAWSLAATLLAVLLHALLRRVALRLRARRPEEEQGLGESVGLVAARWGVRALQGGVWIGLTLLILWLLPRTRPFVYATGGRASVMAERAALWILGPGLVVATVLVLSVLAARFAGAVARRMVIRFGARHGGRVALRAGTLAGTVAAGVQLLVLFIGLLAVLAQLEVDPVPLLASAGVAGIAIGFGVQTLIRDFFTGFFILLEDQYGVGDVIRVGSTSGKVERLSLRITQIRGLDGSLTSIPNGEITTVTNLSKDYAQVVLDASIALGEDVDRATEVLARTAQEVAAAWPEKMRGEPEVLGVETVDSAARSITIRMIVKTAPLERFTVSRELRRRILDAFAQEGIEVPPRSAVVIGGGAGGRTGA
jgi:small conductance mechanosensitive channel